MWNLPRGLARHQGGTRLMTCRRWEKSCEFTASLPPNHLYHFMTLDQRRRKSKGIRSAFDKTHYIFLSIFSARFIPTTTTTTWEWIFGNFKKLLAGWLAFSQPCQRQTGFIHFLPYRCFFATEIMQIVLLFLLFWKLFTFQHLKS